VGLTLRVALTLLSTYACSDLPTLLGAENSGKHRVLSRQLNFKRLEIGWLLERAGRAANRLERRPRNRFQGCYLHKQWTPTSLSTYVALGLGADWPWSGRYCMLGVGIGAIVLVVVV